MRGLLIVNPSATTASPRARAVLADALASQMRLRVVTTEHRGHAAELAAQARTDRLDTVIVMGGDGTVNEAVNGLLGKLGPGPDTPCLGVIPGGSANVFVRALGYPDDPVEATGELISRIKAGSRCQINLGLANGRYFTVNAGIGVDAEIIHAMEVARKTGKEATAARYFATTLRQFFRTDRRHPHLVIGIPGQKLIKGVFLAFVQNASPWTYLGAVPVNPSPLASFDTGLDLWGVRSLSLGASLVNARRMILGKTSIVPASGAVSSNTVAFHDLAEFTVYCEQPMKFQLDGEGLGETERVEFKSARSALKIIM